MWKYFFLSLIISSATGSRFSNVSETITWNDFLTKAKYASQEIIQMLEPYFLEHYPLGNVSEKCTSSLVRFTNGLKEWESWAVRMADAIGKFPSGFITGTMMDFGSYEECLSLKVDSNNESESFKGQFCMMGLRSHLLSNPDKPIPNGRTYEEAYGPFPHWIGMEIEEMKNFYDTFGLYLGICTPSACSQDEIYNILKAIARPAELKVSLEDCHTDEPRKMPTYVFAILVFLSCWLGIIIIGTALDIFDRLCENGLSKQQTENVSSKVLKTFSLYTNTEKLLDTKGSEGQLGYLFGIKSMLCVWVLFGHMIFFEDYWKYNRYSNSNRFSKFLAFDTLLLDSTPLTVDVFLVISGFLMIYKLSKKAGKPKQKESYFKSFFKKYIRLMSPTIFLILFTFVIPFAYNGPIWNTTMDYEVDKCRNYGWSNLLFIHNFYNSSKDMCWAHTWYISAALQIQVASYLILVLIKRFPKTGFTVGFLAVLGCFVHVILTTYQHKFQTIAMVVLHSPRLIHTMLTDIYMKPFLHFPPYIIGMISGYIAKKYPGPLPMGHQTIGWISFIITIVYVIFIYWVSFPPGIIPGLIASTRSSLWAVCWAWLLYACTTNKGILNKFLSWKPFVPLGKLSFQFYIFHALAMIFSNASLRERIFFGRIPLLTEALALTIASFSLAYIAYIGMEIPVSVLCDIWDGKDSSPSRQATTCVKKRNSEVENILDMENIIKKEL